MDISFLQFLDIEDNEISSIPDSIEKLQTLDVLSISKKHLNKSEIEKLTKLLPNCDISRH